MKRILVALLFVALSVSSAYAGDVCDLLDNEYENDMSIRGESAKRNKAMEYAQAMRVASNTFGSGELSNGNFSASEVNTINQLKALTSDISRICANATQNTSYYDSCVSRRYQYLKLLSGCR